MERFTEINIGCKQPLLKLSSAFGEDLKVKDIMFSPVSVCLSFCLCAGYLKKLWTDSDEILWTGSLCDKDELIRFW